MKKILAILVISLIFASSTASAQKLLSFGPRVGINFSTPTGVSSGLSSATGWDFGLSAEVRPIKALGISLDAMYSSQGFHVGMDGGSYNYRLGYLELPLLANIYIWNGLNIKAGVQASILLSNRSDDSGATIINGESFISQATKGIVGIPVGIGYNFGFGLNVDLRYKFALSKVYDTESFRNSLITLGIGWRF